MDKNNICARMIYSEVIREAIIIILLVFFGFLLYANTREAPFIMDDGHNIINNPNIRIKDLSLPELGKAAFKSPLPTRPIANITFALNHYIHQYDATGFRFVNVLLHVMTSIFLYFFIRATLKTPNLRARYHKYKWLPFFVALLWLVHPIQTQSVTYIVQRMNILSSMFYILSLWLYGLGRTHTSKNKKRGYYTGCVLAGLMSLGSKEISATLPIFIFLYEWFFFRMLDRAWLRRQLWPFIIFLLFLTILTFFYLGSAPLDALRNGYQGPDFTMMQRLLTQGRVIVFYLGLIFFPDPARMNLDHDFLTSTSLIEPLTTIISILVLLTILLYALLTAKRNVLLSFCLLWFFGNLAIESSFLALEIVFEHRLYLPSMMIILMIVVLAYRFINPSPLRLVVLCTIAVFLSLWTYERNLIWQNEVSLWDDSAHKSPAKARPNNNLAIALSKKGELTQASDHFKKALQAKPFSATIHKNIGLLMNDMGRTDDAIHHYKWASRIQPFDPKLHYYLGEALMMQNNFGQAIKSFLQALRIKPNYKQAHLKLELSRQQQKRISPQNPLE